MSFPRFESPGVWLRACALAALLAGTACGPSVYTVEVLSARRRVETARDDNARWYAPYELQMAESHLAKAEEEAAEASYEDAIRYARAAESFAQQAMDRTRERREVQ